MHSTRFRSRCAAAILILLVVWALPLYSVSARYLRPDLVNVPVQRVINNLETLAKNNPKDPDVRFNLARAHAMAYAQKTESVEVWKGRENKGVWFGYQPENIPFTVKPTHDASAREAANSHLAKAIERYAEVVELAPDNLAAALGYAWCLDQSGQKQKAIRKYREVIKLAWEKEKDLKKGGLAWHSVTAEAAGYLIPLLNKDKDADEINVLQKRIERMSLVPRPITPLAIPLKNNVVARDFEDSWANVLFDADGTGLQKRWTWITPDAGWLVYDPRHSGHVTSALQLFGGVTFWMFWENGYAALSSLDDDGDGMLTGKELEGLAIWQDRNGNGLCEIGDVKSLTEWGIVAISCRYIRDLKRPDRIAYSPVGVFFADGSHRPTYDIILHPAIETVD